MYWWKITDLRTKKTFNSEELPLNFIPCLEEININKGHLTKHKEVSIEVMDKFRVDLHTGAFWVGGQPIDFVEKPERIILHKRVYKSSNQKAEIVYFVGLINANKHGKLFKIKNKNNYEIKEYTLTEVNA